MPPGMRVRVIAPAGRLSRQDARRQAGSLFDIVIAPRTLARYKKAVWKFFEYLQKNRRNIPNTKDEFDEQLADYVNYLWEDGEGRSLAGDTMSAFQHYQPQLKRNLPTAWRLLGAWQRSELPSRAPPFTDEVVKAVAGLALERQWPDVAILCYVGYCCLLRTGELLYLTKQSVWISADRRQAVLNLGLTKSAQRAGAEESVTVNDALAVQLLQALTLGLLPGDKLCKRPDHDFRAKFTSLVETLGIAEWGYRPYSLRRGGATTMFRETGQLTKVAVYGRWSSGKVARIYINDGLAQLTTMRFSPGVARGLRHYAQLFAQRTAA